MTLISPIQSFVVRPPVSESIPLQVNSSVAEDTFNVPIADMVKTYNNYGSGMFNVVMERIATASNLARMSVPRAIRLLISGIEDCSYFIASLQKDLGDRPMPPELASLIARFQDLQNMVISRIYGLLGNRGSGAVSKDQLLQLGAPNADPTAKNDAVDNVTKAMSETISTLGRDMTLKIRGLVTQAAQIIQSAVGKTGQALLNSVGEILSAKGYLGDAQQLNIGLGVLSAAQFETTSGTPVDIFKAGINEQEGDKAASAAITNLNTQADNILRRIDPRLTQLTGPQQQNNAFANTGQLTR